MAKEKYQYPDVVVQLPELPEGHENFQIVTCNGKRYKIMRGVPVQVPYQIARILQQSEQEQRHGKAYIEKATKVMKITEL